MRTVRQFIAALAVIVATVSNTVAADLPQTDDEGNVVVIAGKQANASYSIYSTAADRKIHVMLSQTEAAKVTINIYDAELNLVFSDAVKEQQINKVYNLTNMPEGTYLVTISGAQVQTARLVTVGQEDNSNFVASISQTEASRMKIAYSQADAFVQINIIDDEGNQVFSETVNEKDFARTYDFSHLHNGTYTLQVVSGSKVYERFYTKN